MRKSLTLDEIVPEVIKDIKNLKELLKDEKINTYQMDLILNSVLYSLEHPEKHFSDGSIIF